MAQPTKPTDLYALPAMTVTDFLAAAKPRLPDVASVLVVDLDRSDDKTLWASAGAGQEWFALPTASVQTIKAIGPAASGSLRRVVCEVVFG